MCRAGAAPVWASRTVQQPRAAAAAAAAAILSPSPTRLTPGPTAHPAGAGAVGRQPVAPGGLRRLCGNHHPAAPPDTGAPAENGGKPELVAEPVAEHPAELVAAAPADGAAAAAANGAANCTGEIVSHDAADSAAAGEEPATADAAVVNGGDGAELAAADATIENAKAFAHGGEPAELTVVAA